MYRKLCASLVFSVLMTSGVVFAQTKTGEAAKKRATQPAPSVYVIRGVLVDKDNAPLAGVKVYIFSLSKDTGPAILPGGVQAIRHSVTLSYKMDSDGKIANPSAETDASGRFAIKANIAFLRHWQIPTGSLVAGAIEDKSSKMLVKADGTPASFSLLGKTTIELGTVKPEAKE